MTSFRKTPQLMVLVLLLLLVIQTSYAIAPLRYLDIITSNPPYALDANGDVVAVYFQRAPTVGIYLIRDDTYYEISLKGVVADVAVGRDRVYVALESSNSLAVVDPYERTTSYVDVGYAVVDLEAWGDKLYIAPEAVGRVIELNAETLEETRVFQVSPADVKPVLAAGGGYLWVLETGLQALAVVDISSGDVKEAKLGSMVKAMGVSPTGDAWALSGSGELLRITTEGKVEKVATLEELRAPEFTIAATDNEAYVFDHIQNKLIMVSLGGGVEEERIRDAALYSLEVNEGRVWFVDRPNGRVGWFSLSKPPSINDVKVERAGLNRIRVAVDVADPEGDVDSVTLVITEYIGGRMAKNTTLSMEKTGGNTYEATHKVREKTDRADLRVVVRDQGGNRVVRSLEKVNIRKLMEENVEVTGEVTATTEAGGPGVDLAVLSQLAAQLLLAIPLLGVVLLLLLRRKTTLRRRTRR